MSAGVDSSGRHLDRAGIMRRWPILAALTAMWVDLWGDVTLANILGGALVSMLVLAVAGTVAPRPLQHFRPRPALRYLGTFAVQLVVASYQVVLAVLQPDRAVPGIIALPLRHASDFVVTLVANSITLTPGTLTLEIERRDDTAVLYVHVLDLSDIDSVRRDVYVLERLAVEAFAAPGTEVVEAVPGGRRGAHGDTRSPLEPGAGDRPGPRADDGRMSP